MMNLISNKLFQGCYFQYVIRLTDKPLQLIVFSFLLLTAAATGIFAQNNLPNQGCEQEGVLKSQNGVAPTSINFVNYASEPVKIYWLDYNGQRVLFKVLAPNASYTQPTFVTHPWLVIGEGGRCEGIFLPTAATGTVVISPPVVNIEASGGEKAELSDYSLTNYVVTNGVYSGRFCFSLKNTSPERLSSQPDFLVGFGFDNSSGANHKYKVTDYTFPDRFDKNPFPDVPTPFNLLAISRGLLSSGDYAYPGNGIKPGETLSFCVTLTDEIPFTLNDLTREFSVLFFDGLPAPRYISGGTDAQALLTINTLSANRVCFSVQNCRLQRVTGIGFDLPGNRGPFELVSAPPPSNSNQLFRFTTAPFRLRYLNGETSGKLDFGFLTSRLFTKGLPQFGIPSVGFPTGSFCVSGDFSGLEPIDILRSAIISFGSDGKPENSYLPCIFELPGIRRTVRSNPR